MNGLKKVQVILYVSSMAISVEFYSQKMGFPVVFPTWPTDLAKEHWVVLEAAGTLVALHAGGPGETANMAPALSFHVEDIHATKADLESKGIQFTPVEEPHPGVMLCHAKDPDGHTVFLHS